MSVSLGRSGSDEFVSVGCARVVNSFAVSCGTFRGFHLQHDVVTATKTERYHSACNNSVDIIVIVWWRMAIHFEGIDRLWPPPS